MVKRRGKQILVGILIATMIAAYFPISVWQGSPVAFAETAAWDGSSATPQQDADGTYLITNGAELRGFADLVDSGEYTINARLENCIDLNNVEWVPMGEFSGNFNGQGHKIYNLNIADTQMESGLFYMITDATIENLTVEGNIDDQNGMYALGGIVAYSNGGTIRNCSNKVNISTVGGGSVGGILGNASSATTVISGCSNYGNLNNAGDDYCGTGGIVGIAESSDLIEINDCYNKGNIADENCVSRSGGIIGTIYSGEINIGGYGSFNEGIVTGAGNPESDFCGNGLIDGAAINYNNTSFYYKGENFLDGMYEQDLQAVMTPEEFCNNEANTDIFVLDGGSPLLKWEFDNKNHKDEAEVSGPTDAEKEAALQELATYKKQADYYDEQWTEIQNIIADTTAKVMAANKMEHITGHINKAKEDIDAVKTKAWMDAGIKKVQNHYNSINKDLYNQNGKNELSNILKEAEKQIYTKTDLSEAGVIADKAISDMSAVMTIKQLEEFGKYQEKAIETVTGYINGVKTTFKSDAAAIRNMGNEYEKYATELENAQRNVDDDFFKPYVTAGTKENNELQNCKNNKAVDEWVVNAKKVIDTNKIKGQLNKISNADDLIAFANAVNKAGSKKDSNGTKLFGILEKNIDLSDKGTVKVGTNSLYGYNGCFFGNNKTITYVQTNEYGSNGLFSYVNNAYIENLNVKGKINNRSDVAAGGVAGTVKGKTTIKNCNSSVNIEYGDYVGGIAGELQSAEANIINCTNQGNISGRTGNAYGGIAGGSDYQSVISIKDSQNKGTIQVEGGSSAVDTGLSGGILGLSLNKANIYGCRNTGKVISISGTGTGGIAGQIKNGAILNCSNNGEILGKKYAGGIIGNLQPSSYQAEDSSIKYCFNEGNIIKNQNELNAETFGGIAGSTGSMVKVLYCYNKGNIDSVKNSGGITGISNIMPAHVYNTGKVAKSSNKTGAITGAYSGNEKSESYYALKGTSSELIGGKDSSFYPEKSGFMNFDEMRTDKFLIDLNFNKGAEEGFQAAKVGINSGYPVFNWQLAEIENDLPAKKEIAKNNIKNEFDLNNYYAPQKNLVETDINKACKEIEAINDSVGKVDVVYDKWIKEIKKHPQKKDIDEKLNAEKENAIKALDAQADFSGYTKETVSKLNGLKSSLSDIINNGKDEINAITSESYAGNFELVKKSKEKYLVELSKVYMDNGIWNGEQVPDKYKPSEEKDAWIVENAVQLAWISQSVNSNTKYANKGIEIKNDIDLGNRVWTPIGVKNSDSSGYNGTFNGNNHKIYGLNCKIESGNLLGGLLGNTGADSVVRDITVGGNITGSLNKKPDSGSVYAGGIAATSDGEIINCTSDVNIVFTDTKAHSGSVLGGISGIAKHIMYCKNNGNIKEDAFSGGTGTGLAGGICGSVSAYGSVIFCENNGDIKSTGSTAGIAASISTGKNSASKIRQCVNRGEITTDNTNGIADRVGAGIVGSASGKAGEILNVYNAGHIEGSGIIHSMKNSGTECNMIVANSYNAGDVERAQIVSKLYHGKIMNCYGTGGKISEETSTTSYTSIESSLIVSPEELKGYAKELGEAYDTDSKNINNGYPVLKYVNDSESTKNAKINAISELNLKAKSGMNNVKYGAEFKTYLDVINNVQKKVEMALTAEEVEKVLKEGNKEILEVKTELEKEKADSLTAIREVPDKNVYSAEKEQEINRYISDAENELKQAENSKDIAAIEKKYKDMIKELSVYTDDTVSELTNYMNQLIKTENADSVKTKELNNVLSKANGLIEEARLKKEKGVIKSEEARNVIDDIFSNSKMEMKTLVTEKTVLPELQLKDDDALKVEKTSAMNNILDAISQGMQEDYNEPQWTEIITIWGDAKSSIETATEKDSITSAENKAVNEIKNIPTKKQTEADLKKLNDAKTEAEKNIDKIMNQAEVLSAAEKDKFKNEAEKIKADIKALEPGKDINKTISDINNKVKTLGEKVNSAVSEMKKNSWTEEAKKPSVKDKTYQITNGAELAWIANEANEGRSHNAVLLNDIDLAGKKWTPIGTVDHEYSGKFEGNGNTIKNMYITDKLKYAGIFGKTEKTEITNVNVSGTIESEGHIQGTYAGGIAGMINGGKISNCISDIKFVSKVALPDAYGMSELNAGGIAGKVTGKTLVDKCQFTGTTEGEYYKALAGIVAEIGSSYNTDVTISECANLGNLYYTERYKGSEIDGKENAVTGCGGITGIIDNNNVIITKSYNGGNIHGVENAGGIVGHITDNISDSQTVSVNHVYNYGKVTAESFMHGGIAGRILAGEFKDNVYMLEGSSNKPVGVIIIPNNVKVITSEELASKDICNRLNDHTEIFISSIAGINNGYPVFARQLMETSVQNEIKTYISSLVSEDSFNEEQWKDVEKAINASNKSIDAALNPAEVVKSYEEAATKLNEMQSEMKNRISEKLKAYDTSAFSSEMKQDVENIINAKADEILTAETTAKTAEVLYDKALAEITDYLINSIDKNITSDSEKGITLARNAYEKLTPAQRDYVANFILLTRAESKFRSERDTAKETEKLIDAIRTVDHNSCNAIKDAKASFEKLTDAQKTFIAADCADVIKKAEEKYNKIHEGETIPTVKTDGNADVKSENTSVKVGANEIKNIGDSLDVSLANGSKVKYDKKAMNSVKKHITDDVVNVEIVLEESQNGINERQQKAIKKYNALSVFNIKLITKKADGKINEIRDFEGGNVTVSVRYNNPDNIKLEVYRVEDNGKITLMKSSYSNGILTWNTGSHSYYMVKEVTPEAKPEAKPSTRPSAGNQSNGNSSISGSTEYRQNEFVHTESLNTAIADKEKTDVKEIKPESKDNSVIINKDAVDKSEEESGQALDLSMIPIAGGIVVLVIVTFLLISWFNKSKKTRR